LCAAATADARSRVYAQTCGPAHARAPTCRYSCAYERRDTCMYLCVCIYVCVLYICI
jgi:hypothetical protein